MRINNPSILITRPVSESLLNEMNTKGLDADVIPFIQTEIIRTKQVQQQIENISGLNTTVIFTSITAVETVAENLQNKNPGWKIFCIGNTTKKSVEKTFGEASIIATADNATELAEKIISHKSSIDEAYFFCGDKRRNELPELLLENNIALNEVEVYTTTILKSEIKKEYDAVLFFSPSAVEGFFENNSVKEKTVLFAIGNTTAEAIKKFTKNKIVISDKAGKEDLVEKVISFFEN